MQAVPDIFWGLVPSCALRLPLRAGTIAAWLLLAAASPGAGSGREGDGSPVVTPREAALLQEVQALGEHDVAAAIGRLQIELRPEVNPALLYALGCLHARNGETAAAAAVLSETVQRRPDFLQARLDLASVLAQRERYTEARAHLRRILVQAPGFGEARLRLAGVCLKQGRLPEAAGELEAVIAGNDDAESARLLLASVYLEQDRPDAALAELEQLIGRHPENLQAHRNLIAILAARQPTAAITRLRALLRRWPEESEARLNLAALLAANQQLPEAAAELEQILAQKPTHAEARFRLAALLVQQDRAEAAIQHLHLLLQQHSDHDEAQLLLASLDLQQGRSAEAIAGLTALLQRAPSRHEARRGLVNALFQEQRYAEALQHLNLLLDSDVEDKGALWQLLGFACRCLDRSAAAEIAYRNALRYAPDSSEVLTGLVRVLLDQGDTERARPLLREELSRHPAHKEPWRLLADADLRAGQQTDALVRLLCLDRLGQTESSEQIALGDLLLNAGLADEAVLFYLRANVEKSIPPDRLLSAVEALVAVGHLGQAEKLLVATTSEHELEPAQERRRQRVRARLAAAQGKTAAALTQYRELLAAAPLDGPLLLDAGQLLQKMGELDEAEGLYARAGRTSADLKPQTLVRQAQLAVERHDYRRAVGLLEESLALQPRSYVQRYLDQIRRLLSAN